MKSKKFKLFTFILLIFSLFQINVLPTQAIETTYVSAKAGIVADYDTGAIYFGKEIDKEIGLASISKFFVVSYFLDKMEEKEITMETTIPISNKVAQIKNVYQDASGIYLPEGEEVSVRKLIELSLVFSDNGATIQLAEALLGSEEEFVKTINQYFIDNNAPKTKFVNVSGLDEEKDGKQVGNVSTAREVARLAIMELEKHPEILEFTQKENVEFNGEIYKSWDEMLPNQPHEYPGVKGLKTGSSEVAGFSYLGYNESNDKKTITLVADAYTAEGIRSRAARFTETARLLDYAKRQELENLITKETPIEVTVKNNGLGNDNFFPKKNLAVIKGSSSNVIFDSISYNENYFNNQALTKTIPQGTVVATLKLKSLEENNNLSIYFDGEAINVDLVNTGDTQKENIFLQILYSVPRFFVGLFNAIY